MPHRIQRKRTKDWRLPKGAVCIDRTTKWGNRYRVTRSRLGGWAIVWGNYEYWPPYKTRAEAVRVAVRWYATRQLRGKLREAAQRELRGKDLACWCKLGDPCHGDPLLEAANLPAPPRQAGSTEANA